MSHSIKISDSALQLAQTKAQKLMDEVTGVTAVVLATVDGFDIASALRVGDSARIAATASSIAAISAVVSEEAHLGRTRSVTIDTESGFAVVHSVHRSDTALIIHVVADARAILAQVNYRVSQLARQLTDA